MRSAFLSSALVVVACCLFCPRDVSAGFITVADIDPLSTNDVDQSATFGAATGIATASNVIDLATFRAALAGNYASDLGGCIDFEVRNDSDGNPVGSLDSPTAISGRYGASANLPSGHKLLTISSGSGTWRFPGLTTSGRIPTSGVNSLGKDSTDVFDFEILIDSITNGAPNEHVRYFGFTVLERSGTNLGVLNATATFSNGSTVRSGASITGATPASDEDSFYGFISPAGTSIVSVRFDPINFTTVDDVAFITDTSELIPVPEPSGAAAIVAIASAFLVRRRSSGSSNR
jgi:hypothetical protein